MLVSTGEIKVVEYERKDGNSPFGKWFDGLDVQAALRIDAVVARMKQGNFSNVKSVGQGVSEYRVNIGPGYRVYFGRDGDKLVVLLGGGTKKSQSRDIEKAKGLWMEYKSRKKEGEALWH